MSRDNKVKLKSSDDEMFEVDEQDAFESQTVKNMIEDTGTDSAIPLPNVSSKILAKEAILKKKYGGLIPKKPPLISKDHERAFFDSADWALGKQGAPPNPLLGGVKPRSSMEGLRPKLQPTPHQPLPARRSSYAPTDGEEGEPGTAPEDEHSSN